MALINRQNQKNSLPNDYWKEVNQKTHALVAQILQEKMPLPDLDKLNLEKDRDYRDLLAGYQAQYQENLPEIDQVAHEIAYEYLLLVSKSIVNTLKGFTCHQEEYLEGVI